MLTALLLTVLLQTTTPSEPSAKGYVYIQVSPEKLRDGQVSVFSVCLDDRPCEHVTPESSAVPDFANWYRWKLPALLVGSHTVTVQLCNPVECGAAVAEPFRITIAPGVADKVVVR